MSKIGSERFTIAQNLTSGSQTMVVGNWEYFVEPMSASAPHISRVDTLVAFQPNIHSRITFNPTNGWLITEGWQPDDVMGYGNQGVVVMGNSLHLTNQGWTVSVDSRMPKNNILTVSIAEQTRRTVDTDGKVPGTVRGFNAPQISPEDMATIEMYEEAGYEINNHIEEVGLPVNMMPYTMLSRSRGGANFFSIKFPSRILEVSDVIRRRWRIKSGVFQKEAPHKEFEGVSKSEFVDVREVASQQIWSGTADGYTVISAARSIITNCRLNFDGFWNRLARAKKASQSHADYPVRRLDAANFHELIGQKPLWDIQINGQQVALSSLWVRNMKTGQEVCYGDKPEATRYDGFTFNSHTSVIMPVVEIDGNLYVGGRLTQPQNTKDGVVLQSTTIEGLNTDTQHLLTQLANEVGLNNLEKDGVVLAVEKVGGPINPNSAHGTWLTQVTLARVSPEKIEKTGPNRYRIKDSVGDFVFVPIRTAILKSSHGPTVTAASVALSGANIVSLK